MTDALSRCVATFLRRASLLAGLLGIIAGIFGMHVMTGPHSMPASTVVQGVEMMQVMQPPAAAHSSPAPRAATAIGSSLSPDTRSMPGPSCADLGGCAMSSMDGSCIPSPGNASLAAPLPGQTPFAAHDDGDAPTPGSAYSYLPGSPSPGQLCISRT